MAPKDIHVLILESAHMAEGALQVGSSKRLRAGIILDHPGPSVASGSSQEGGKKSEAVRLRDAALLF
jgi:hypothetical protein